MRKLQYEMSLGGCVRFLPLNETTMNELTTDVYCCDEATRIVEDDDFRLTVPNAITIAFANGCVHVIPRPPRKESDAVRARLGEQ